MNTVTMNYFIAVIDEGNISSAAQKLFISRQALSKALKQMEKELGTELIQTDHRGITPTPAGKLFYQNARKILKIWASTQHDIAELNGNGTILRIGFGEISHHLWPIDQQESFMKQNPSVQISSESGLPDILIRHLRSGYLDAIITNAYPSEEGYIIHTLLERPMYAMVEAGSALAKKKFITPADLDQKVNVFIPEDQSDWKYFSRMMEILGYSCREMVCPDPSLPTVFSMVRRYHGVFLTSAIFQAQLSSPDFVFVEFRTGLPHHAYNLDIRFIFPKDSSKLSSLKLYESFLKNNVQKEFTAD
ncbi:MAG: LysR family transcriptional regulator [Bulleidia sp.]